MLCIFCSAEWIPQPGVQHSEVTDNPVLRALRESMSGMFPEEQVVDSYLRHYALKEEQDFWAFDEVNQIVRRDPAAGWRLTRLLVDKASSDEALAYVAAGPLEDLLAFHGPTVIDDVAVAARADERLQLALTGVWLNRASPIWERWFALMNEFGFSDGKRIAL